MIRRILLAGLGGIAGFLLWMSVIAPIFIAPETGRLRDRMIENKILGMVLCVLTCGAVAMLGGEKLGLVPSQEQLDENMKPVSLFEKPSPVGKSAVKSAESSKSAEPASKPLDSGIKPAESASDKTRLGCELVEISAEAVVQRSELILKAGESPNDLFCGFGPEGILTAILPPKQYAVLLFTTPFAARDYVRTVKVNMNVHKIPMKDLAAESHNWTSAGVNQFMLNRCPRCGAGLAYSMSLISEHEKFLKVWAIDLAARRCRAEVLVAQHHRFAGEGAMFNARAALETIRDHIDCGNPYVHQSIALLSAGMDDKAAELAASERLKEFGPEFEWTPVDFVDDEKLAHAAAVALTALTMSYSSPAGTYSG